MNEKIVKLDQWLLDILVDPLSKRPLTLEGNLLKTTYGRQYPIRNMIYDLRMLNNETTADQKLWKEGQLEYERWSSDLAALDGQRDYLSEIEGVREVYQAIPVTGRCLDVGGHQGRLRQFLSPGQEYVSCDPFLNVFDHLDRQPNLLKAYPFLRDPVNFLCCDAEFLPFDLMSFDTVHMRSVIDHFFCPELALNEAYRVLKTNGALVVGLFVQGGKSGKSDIKSVAKELLRDTLVACGMTQYKDYHVWHPTHRELVALIQHCGFKIEIEHWQKGSSDTVCYLLARKQNELMRRS
jgi:SAM-dependent methyltransferase